MRCLGDIERLDATLASLAGEEAALRLRLGQLLEVIGRGAVFELGFSSLGAYAVERCERSVRWAEAARCLARRLEALPKLRLAMATAKVSWSMGELLARVATQADESRWLELAQRRTVRQIRVLVTEGMTAVDEAAVCLPHTSGTATRCAEAEKRTAISELKDIGSAEAEKRTAVSELKDIGSAEADGLASGHHGDGDPICTLTRTVDREDAWLFEATRCLLEQLGASGAVAQADALLAEAQGALIDLLPSGTIDLCALHGGDRAQQRWVQQLRRWRDQAEASCEKRVCQKNGVQSLLSTRASSAPAERLLSVVIDSSLGIGSLEHASCTALDEQVRALTALLAGHELELSVLVLRFLRADGWRRLGYATQTQYARERLGLSRSSLLARRTLALRLEKLPGIAAALGSAQIGVEAALQLARVATPKTEAAWVERARRRTIKHLREEVGAALTAVRVSGESDCLPPEQTDMEAFQALEQAVVGGQLGQPRAASDARGATASPLTSAPRDSFEPFSGASSRERQSSEARRPWSSMLGSLAAWLETALQMSATGPSSLAARPRSSAGRVTLRLRMSRETYRWWRGLEAQARRWLPSGVSWLRFLCLSVWHAWRHLLGTHAAYGDIYIRDRFRCTSPVCNRRDLTPHHIEFRSAGGSDAAHNLTSVCVWCHLHGIHGGRIRALGTAGDIHWELGPRNAPCLVVQGRERVALFG